MVKAMTDKKRNVPNLRFRGFTETWEQRKFSDIAQRISTNININLPNVTYDDIDSENETLNKGIKNLSSGKKGILFQKNDILFGKLRPYLNNIIKVDFKGIAVGDFWVLRAYEDSSFLFSLINTPQYKYIANISSGSKMPRSDWNLVSKYLFCIPSEKEQSHIGNLILKLSQLITLNQRKLEQLKLIKKALLQKMFADGKNSFPVIRFSGFTNAWEQRKLGDLGSLKNGMNFSKDKMGIGFPFVNLQDVFGKSIVTKQHLDKAQATDSQLRTYNLFKGDVLFVRSSVKLEGVGQAVVVPSDFINTTYSGFLIRFRDQTNLDNKFKSQIFKARNIRTQIMSKATDSANKNINQSSLAKLKIVFPSKTEQEKIGKLLEDLDKVITLHQRKLDQLQKLKKSLLQNMFI